MDLPVPDVADAAYGADSPRQALDVYRPDGAGPCPLVVLVHGGAFLMGDKRAEQLAVVPPLLDRGFAVASIGYRLSDEAVFPAAVQDAKAAVRWLRAHADGLGVDPQRIAAWGASAGGYLAAMLGLTGDQATELDATSDAPVDASLAAVVDWFGPVRFSAMDGHDRAAPPTAEPDWLPPWPRSHDHPQSPESRFLGGPVQEVPEVAHRSDPTAYAAGARVLPPFLVVHGDADPLVPHLQSVLLADVLRAHGGEVELHVLPGLGHGGPGWTEAVLPLTLDWLVARLNP